MTKKSRTVLFLICFCIFLLIAPAVVFYSEGYRIDFKNKKISQTGAFYFKVSQRSADIYLNGKLAKKTGLLFGDVHKPASKVAVSGCVCTQPPHPGFVGPAAGRHCLGCLEAAVLPDRLDGATVLCRTAQRARGFVLPIYDVDHPGTGGRPACSG